jgi:hypothetical protein
MMIIKDGIFKGTAINPRCVEQFTDPESNRFARKSSGARKTNCLHQDNSCRNSKCDVEKEKFLLIERK